MFMKGKVKNEKQGGEKKERRKRGKKKGKKSGSWLLVERLVLRVHPVSLLDAFYFYN